MSGQGNPRRTRVAQAMRDVLAEMIDRQVNDPRVRAAGFASINHVELNRDMSVARVYISFIGPADESDAVRDRAIAGLQAAAGFLRGPVGRKLRLRHAPEIRFAVDDSPAFSQRIGQLVRTEKAAKSDPASGDPVAGAPTEGESASDSRPAAGAAMGGAPDAPSSSQAPDASSGSFEAREQWPKEGDV